MFHVKNLHLNSKISHALNLNPVETIECMYQLLRMQCSSLIHLVCINLVAMANHLDESPLIYRPSINLKSKFSNMKNISVNFKTIFCLLIEWLEKTAVSLLLLLFSSILKLFPCFEKKVFYDEKNTLFT